LELLSLLWPAKHTVTEFTISSAGDTAKISMGTYVKVVW
jgi:hypothetical protein